MKKSIDILINYLTCEDPVIKSKWLDILQSFHHKDDGELITGYTIDEDGNITFSFTDNSTLTIEKFVMPNTMPISFIEGLQSLLNGKVDKVVGKQLTDENFTALLKQKLEQLQNYVHPDTHSVSEIEGLQDLLDSKVTSVLGKQLSDENFTASLKRKLEGLVNYVKPSSEPMEYIEGLIERLNLIDVGISQKVPIVDGKELSSNDFTDELFQKLVNLRSDINVYNLSNKESFLNYEYFGKKTNGILLSIPEKLNNSYVFTHNLKIEKYLRLEVWEDGLPFENPKMKAREDLTQLVYTGLSSEIGSSAIGSTPIGATSEGGIVLTSDSVTITGSYQFPTNKLLYIEYTYNRPVGVGNDSIGSTAIK